MIDYLITGTGRCGTGYVAKVLTGVGVPCGHESIFTKDGFAGAISALRTNPELRAEASWLAAPYLRDPLLQDTGIVHLVRHPKLVIESLLRVGFFNEQGPYDDYREFVYSVIPGLADEPTEEAKAAAFYVEWNRLIEDSLTGREHTRHRVEDDARDLLTALGISREGPIYPNKRYNAATGKTVSIDIRDYPGVAEMARRYGYETEPEVAEPQVYWSLLIERAVMDRSVNAALDVAMTAGMNGYVRISIPYARTDAARNMIIDAFCGASTNPDDVLIMLDCDHRHPPDILTRIATRLLSNPEEGVLGALAFRRSAPYEPMFFVRQQDSGFLRPPAEFERVVYRCDATGTGAVGIQRWVFDKLREAGHPYFFRYEYQEIPGGWRSSEDMHFARLCEGAGIKHFVDCSLETPHIRLDEVTSETWEKYKIEHPELVGVQEG